MPIVTDDHPTRSDDELLATRAQFARFLTGLAHELKTPLASLAMLGELLGREQGHGRAVADGRYTENLRKLTREMQGLVQDVGTLARLVSSRVPLRSEPTSPAEVGERAMEEVRGTGWERGVSLSPHIDSGLPAAIWTDPGLLEQALTRLLETAVILAEKRVDVHVRALVREIHFVVEPDRGCGSDLELEALFDPFESGTSRTLKQQGGHVLAPLLAREAARALGGRLETVVEEGRTRCVLRIPREAAG